ncbi:MAG: hypothetical protein GW936_00235, partial [Gallionella sp.]|nr:hypothetical protein [Gallionella sp.]
VLVEYTVYWHYKGSSPQVCYGEAGWTKTPVPDDTTCTPVDDPSCKTSPAAGSTDPKLGDLSGTSGATVTGITRVVDPTTGVVTITITYSNGAQATITRSESVDTITTETCDADGNCVTDVAHKDTADASIVNGGDERGTRAHTGRVSWHELLND